METHNKDENEGVESLKEIAFLVNSVNRFGVLENLTDSEHSRHVLAERLDVSRVTIARILDDLEERQWISQHGQIAEITPLGAWVVEEVSDLRNMMIVERKLRPVIEWFPEEGFEFHIRCLKNAHITRVTAANATSPIDHLVRQLDHTEHVQAFSFAITGQFLNACWKFVIDRGHTFDWVFTTDVLAVLTENEVMRRQSREMLESGRASFFHFDDSIPYVVIITDEKVNLRLADASGAPSALIQAQHHDVRSWAVSMYATYRDAATPVEADLFAV